MGLEATARVLMNFYLRDTSDHSIDGGRGARNLYKMSHVVKHPEEGALLFQAIPFGTLFGRLIVTEVAAHTY